MNDDADKLKQLLESPDGNESASLARELSRKYPYFPMARALELRNRC